MKEYLCKYLDHCITNEDYAIKEQHFFEKLFNIAFSHNEEKSVFYIGNVSFNRKGRRKVALMITHIYNFCR